MKNLIITFLFLVGIFNALTAQYNEQVPIISPDSLIEIQISKDIQKIYVHRVTSKQTLYSISKLFEVPISYLTKINKIDKEVGLQLGQQLFIPIRDNLIVTTQPKDIKNYTRLVYKVKKKETIFRIARIYFDLEIEQLKQNNNLKDLGLDVGQLLTVGWFRINDNFNISTNNNEEVESIKRDSAYFVKTLEDQVIESDTTFVVKTPKYERGIALWNKESQTNQHFVLHKTAAINSEIELYNPLQEIRTKAKVVGHIPPNTYPADIDVILSPATAKILGALDSRFLVEMKYFE